MYIIDGNWAYWTMDQLQKTRKKTVLHSLRDVTQHSENNERSEWPRNSQQGEGVNECVVDRISFVNTRMIVIYI